MAELLTGVASATGLGSTSSNRSIALSGTSSTGRVGIVPASQSPFQGLVLTAPVAVLAMTGITGQAASLTLPMPAPSLAMQATTPAAAQLYLTVPAPALAMGAQTGKAATLVLEVPAVSIRMSGSDGLAITVPMPQLSLAGVTGNTAVFAPTVAMPTLAMTGVTNALATLSLPAPIPVLNLAAGQGVAAALHLPAPNPALLMTGTAGKTGTLTLAVPAPELRFAGGLAVTGSLQLIAPVPGLNMVGFTTTPSITVEATRVTYAMQTERLALSMYSNYGFNSFAFFNGKALGANDSGIFELTGDTDAGEKINAEARFGITDMNTSRVKRVDRVYIGYRGLKGAQSLILRVMTNETQQRDYGVPASVNTMLHGARTRLGMGVDSRYWQFGLLNRDGLDFTIDSIEVAPIPYNRRRGSKDA